MVRLSPERSVNLHYGSTDVHSRFGAYVRWTAQ
jgi:hypothetical protein